MSNRLPVGRYTVAYHIVDFNGYTETINSIKNNPPKYIIYYPMDNRPFIELDNIIKDNYIHQQTFDSSILVFKKK